MVSENYRFGLPVQFILARMLVSGSLSIANQVAPDLLHASHRSKHDALALAAKVDSLSTITQFFTRPLYV